MLELVFILDRSGSMQGLEMDTIGGFNSMLAKQKKEEGQVLVSTLLFDNETKVIHDRQPIDQVQPLTLDDYEVGGCTALLDALGGAIHHMGNVHKYARTEDRPDRTLFVIITDGAENASHLYTYQRVKAMIDRQKNRFGWDFLYLGANIDAAKEAGRFGIGKEMAATYLSDQEGTALNFQVISEAVTILRASHSPLSSKWKSKIEEDYQKRGRKE